MAPPRPLRRHIFRLEGSFHRFEFSIPVVLSAARQLGLSLSKGQNDSHLLFLADEALQDQYTEEEAEDLFWSGRVPPAPISRPIVLDCFRRLVADRKPLPSTSSDDNLLSAAAGSSAVAAGIRRAKRLRRRSLKKALAKIEEQEEEEQEEDLGTRAEEAVADVAVVEVVVDVDAEGMGAAEQPEAIYTPTLVSYSASLLLSRPPTVWVTRPATALTTALGVTSRTLLYPDSRMNRLAAWPPDPLVGKSLYSKAIAAKGPLLTLLEVGWPREPLLLTLEASAT